MLSLPSTCQSWQVWGFDMPEFHYLVLYRFPWLCLSVLPSHPSPSNKHQLLIPVSAQLLPLESPLPSLSFRLSPPSLRICFGVLVPPSSAGALPGFPLSPPAALAHTGRSRHECPAKTGQRETSAFLLSEPGAALDKPILPMLEAAQPALVRGSGEEKPHNLTNALGIPVSISSGSAAGFAVGGAGAGPGTCQGSQGALRALLYGLPPLDRRREPDIKDVFPKGAFYPLAS